jgi:hypothetical protein
MSKDADQLPEDEIARRMERGLRRFLPGSASTPATAEGRMARARRILPAREWKRGGTKGGGTSIEHTSAAMGYQIRWSGIGAFAAFDRSGEAGLTWRERLDVYAEETALQ